MTKNEAQKKLSSIQQDHLLKYWSELSASQQYELLQQIENLNISAFEEQVEMLKELKTSSTPIHPFTDYSYSGNEHHKTLGKQLLAAGKVGCLIIAGGQGTHLRISGPKGLFPITPITKKSLFQLFAEKTVAAGKQVGRPLPLAIMTSPENHEATVWFFESNHFFGLQKEQISFFSQDELPLLDTQKNLFLENCHKIAEGPDGNGFALKQFVLSGIWQRWHNAGVRFLNFVLIDNPLADPFDAELIGFHSSNQVDVTVKCTLRRDENEKVGLLVKKGNDTSVTAVVEYSEMDKNEQTACNPDGTFWHRCANLSLFCFSMDFVQKSKEIDLPLHKAFKAVKYLDEKGKQITPDSPNAWKFERFIFDLLPEAKAVKALLYPREECFAPLKNFSGPDSIEDVQAALLAEAKRIAERVTGLPAPAHPFELPAEFFYPTPQLLAKWKGQPIPPF